MIRCKIVFSEPFLFSGVNISFLLARTEDKCSCSNVTYASVISIADDSWLRHNGSLLSDCVHCVSISEHMNTVNFDKS